MTRPAPTWTYENNTLTHVASEQSLTIDPEANRGLHKALRAARRFYLPKEYSTDYSKAPDEAWVERKVRFNRAQEDPVVIGVEDDYNSNTFTWYTVKEAEDQADGLEYVDQLAALLNIPVNKARKMAWLITKAQRARGLY